MDRIRKQCLWRGNDRTARGGHLATWPMVSKPKIKGGLGILNLRLQKDVPWVQLVWHKYYSNGLVPHGHREVGSFWWKDLLRLSVLYRGIAKCQVGDGSTILFWEDLWCPQVLSTQLPCLFSFARDQRISVRNVVEAEDLYSLFMLPLFAQAHAELLELQNELQSVLVFEDQNDVCSLMWGYLDYSSSKFYSLVFKNMAVHPSFTWLWKSKCTPRIKFFGWLLFVHRLNTRNMLRRRHFHIDSGYTCVMCSSGAEEDILHLFFVCPFAVSCWQTIGLHWPAAGDLQEKLSFGRRNSTHGFFMEIFLVPPGSSGTSGMTKFSMVRLLAELFGFRGSRSKKTFSS